MSGTKSIFEEALKSIESPADIPPELISVVAERVEEAVANSNRAELDELKSQLADFFRALLKKAPTEAVAAARRTPEAPLAATSAFVLGQIGFAQHFAAQSADRRADDSFVEVLSSPQMAAYVRALLKQDLTGQELSAAVGERTETVSRKLKTLRDLGIVDYRRDGVRMFNFLTPSAQAAFQDTESVAKPQRAAIQRLMQDRQKQTPDHFKEWPTFVGGH
ncbi:helix-turn-helix domain-containing protein [Mesorhizobium sp. L2C067A000]|uniref:helix-turn-helix domain-containing protein n=1 Tax=Mesorhizobium sp. L2C067A000 TaxID=1287106 RepID=UPI0003D0058E|nr:helix-turn-helix domain-containing protein [Mesorhizobium sp. L2C067A000]ESZ26591.1 hypothetical protein X733_29430 [Mesorhizobium sp. L2C067A000]